MTNNRINSEELKQIRKSAEKAARGNPLRDGNTLALMNIAIIEDIPKLISEIERLQQENETLRYELLEYDARSDMR